MPPKSKVAKPTKEPSAAGPTTKLKPATAINVRHILNAKQSASLAAIALLEAGTDFGTVAREHSEDKARQGGALGWKVRGSLLQDFEKVAYELQVSTTGKPIWGTVKTGEGYHIVMVEGRR